jgi:hypothetical protein
MTIENQLKNYILSKYKSVRSFSIEANIPYSTIENILNRSISNAGVATVLKICNSLNLDIECLVKNEIVLKKSSENSFVLNVHQQKVITAYINQPDMQKSIDRLLNIDTDDA